WSSLRRQNPDCGVDRISNGRSTPRFGGYALRLAVRLLPFDCCRSIRLHQHQPERYIKSQTTPEHPDGANNDTESALHPGRGPWIPGICWLATLDVGLRGRNVS